MRSFVRKKAQLTELQQTIAEPEKELCRAKHNYEEMKRLKEAAEATTARLNEKVGLLENGKEARKSADRAQLELTRLHNRIVVIDREQRI